MNFTEILTTVFVGVEIDYKLDMRCLCVSEMQPHFYQNIALTGGNTLFPGFRDRVYSDVRALAPTEYKVNVLLPEK